MRINSSSSSNTHHRHNNKRSTGTFIESSKAAAAVAAAESRQEDEDLHSRVVHITFILTVIMRVQIGVTDDKTLTCQHEAQQSPA